MVPISRRESEILDCVYKLGKPTAKEVMREFKDDLSYSTIRTLLKNLVDKGWLDREEKGLKYIYLPKFDRATAAKKDLKRVISTYYSNSLVMAVNSFLDLNKDDFSDAELQQLEKLVKNKRKEINKK